MAGVTALGKALSLASTQGPEKASGATGAPTLPESPSTGISGAAKRALQLLDIPQWMPDGSPINSHKQLAVVMGVSENVAESLWHKHLTLDDRERLQDSNLYNHAERELRLIGMTVDDPDEMNSEMTRHILEMVAQFVSEGHSGMSAGYAIGVLEKLLRFENLSPLTDDPSEWNEVSYDDNVWQSRRRPDAFSNDGGKTYYLLDEKPRRTHKSEPAGRPEAGKSIRSALLMQWKVVRHVRTEAGVQKYKQPIGSVIVADGVLSHLKSVETDYPGWAKLEDSKGRSYYIGKYEGRWSVADKDDNELWSGGGTDEDEEGAYKWLNLFVQDPKSVEASTEDNFPVGSHGTTVVYNIHGNETVSGEVVGHKYGHVLLNTETHGILSVEPAKLQKTEPKPEPPRVPETLYKVGEKAVAPDDGQEYTITVVNPDGHLEVEDPHGTTYVVDPKHIDQFGFDKPTDRTSPKTITSGDVVTVFDQEEDNPDFIGWPGPVIKVPDENTAEKKNKRAMKLIRDYSQTEVDDALKEYYPYGIDPSAATKIAVNDAVATQVIENMDYYRGLREWAEKHKPDPNSDEAKYFLSMGDNDASHLVNLKDGGATSLHLDYYTDNFKKRYGITPQEWVALDEAGREKAYLRSLLREVNLPSDTDMTGEEVAIRKSVRHIIQTWAGTSGDHNPSAVALQRVVQDMFGIGDAETSHISSEQTYGFGLGDKSFNNQVDEQLAEHRPMMTAFVRSTYELTQNLLEEEGIKSVVLYRGVNLHGDKMIPQGSAVATHYAQPASSWSSKKGVAWNFGSTVFQAEIPSELILSCAISGLGCLNEWEFVVLGGEGTSKVVKSPGYYGGF